METCYLNIYILPPGIGTQIFQGNNLVKISWIHVTYFNIYVHPITCMVYIDIQIFQVSNIVKILWKHVTSIFTSYHLVYVGIQIFQAPSPNANCRGLIALCKYFRPANLCKYFSAPPHTHKQNLWGRNGDRCLLQTKDPPLPATHTSSLC